ncbi:MAG: divalent-cation tolerance protein CutA [Deltaproteobacteria bacterium]|nr:divalent-cation tolerance protein CutA [Deltaproteobacteria bacterium]
MIIFTTVSSQKIAKKISEILVQEKLVACVNIIPQLTSIYIWKNKLCREKEILLMMKTRREKYAALEKRLRQIHPYETPEIIGIKINKGSKDYLNWILETLSRK